MKVEQPGVTAFTELSDVPNSYLGDAGEHLVVNGTETGIEFVPGGGGTPGGSDTQVQFNDGGSFGGDAGLTYNKTTNLLTVDGAVHTSTIQAHTSAGLTLETQGGADIALFGAGGGQNATFYDGVKLNAQTASRILSTDGSSNITALDTATYPTLTELSYVKGVTSVIQTQIGNKQDTLVSGTNIKTVNGNTLLGSGDVTISSSVAWGGITGTLSSQTDLQTALDGKVDENVAITGATKTKITYDAKGLVTSGADATTADIADSLNKRYVTDAQLTVIGNTSGTNTGDQTSIVGITGTLAEFNTALTGADFATGGGTVTGTSSGTNTGDQTSIVGITGTKAQFDTAVTDGNIVYTDAIGVSVQGYSSVLANTTASFLTADETKLDFITVTQAVNLDTLESDTVTNNAKVSNATHTGDATGATALTVVKIQGKDFPTLSAADDQKYPKYDNGTNAFVMTTIAGGGNVSNTGTPANNQIAVWTNSTTIEGDANLTFDTTTDLLTTGAIALAAGTATLAPIKLTAGTNLTTAEDGAIEMDADCFYGCTDAGNRGVIPVEHIIRADATRTFTSNTSQQAIFTTPASGTLTLETGTYLFEGLIAMTSMSATSGNGKFSLIGTGTATLGSILWQAYGNDNASQTTGAATGVMWSVIATQTAANIVTAGAGTAMAFLVKGTFEVTGAGTIIPSFAQTTAAAAVVSIGSYIKFNRIGSTTMTSVGQWT